MARLLAVATQQLRALPAGRRAGARRPAATARRDRGRRTASGALLAAGLRAGLPPPAVAAAQRGPAGDAGQSPAAVGTACQPPRTARRSSRHARPRSRHLTTHRKESRTWHRSSVSASAGRRDRRLRGEGLRGHPGRAGREGLHLHAHRAVRGLGRPGQHAHGDPHQPEGLRHPPRALRSRLADGLGHPRLPDGRRRGVPRRTSATTTS